MKIVKCLTILLFFCCSIVIFNDALITTLNAAVCTGDFDFDSDIDGQDVVEFININYGLTLETFATNFGQPECTVTQNGCKVGLSVALTGPTSEAGVGYAYGIEDYFNFVNSTDLLGQKKIQCFIRDDEYNLDITRINFENFLYENILVFLGYSTSSMMNMKNEFEQEMIPVIPASLHSQNIVNSNYIYLVGASYDEQIVALGEYIDNFHSSNTPKVALYIHPSAFGRIPKIAITDAVNAGLDIEIIDTIEHSSEIDLTVILNNLVDQGVQYILCQTIQTPVANLLNTADNLGIIATEFGESGKITFLGAHYTGGNDLLSLINTTTTNYFWITSLIGTSELSIGREKQYELAQMNNRDNETANSMFYTNGILVAQITTEVIKRLLVKGIDITRSSIKSELEMINGENSYSPFSSVGPVNFSATDHVGVNTLQIYQIQDGVFKTYGDAFESSISE